MEAQRAHNTTPSLAKEEAPPVELIPLPSTADVDHMPPGPTNAPSPIRAVAQIIPTTGTGGQADRPSCPVTPD